MLNQLPRTRMARRLAIGGTTHRVVLPASVSVAPRVKEVE